MPKNPQAELEALKRTADWLADHQPPSPQADRNGSPPADATHEALKRTIDWLADHQPPNPQAQRMKTITRRIK